VHSNEKTKFYGPRCRSQTKRRRKEEEDEEQVLQFESKKILPEDLWQFFQNGWEFFNQILRAYYAFPSTLDYKFLFSYLHL